MAYDIKCFLDTLTEILPQPLNVTTEKTLSRSWCAWKRDFILFLTKNDIKESYKDQWATLLLTLIGPFGEQAYEDLSRNISFKDSAKNFDMLLRELDLYFIFGSKKRQINENIDNYIDDLMLIAIASNHSDPVNIAKEKIIEDIKNCNFTGTVLLFVQSKGENLSSYFQSLNFHEITLFWKQCEEIMLQTNRQKIKHPSTIVNCIRCGTQHSKSQCPAHGVQCKNCKQFNHFTNNCKVTYVHDCTKCGTNHLQSRCIAFGELCTKCGKLNHFSWKCQVPFVKDCSRCGRDHSISTCPAQGRICFRCQKPNHLENQCISKHNTNKK